MRFRVESLRRATEQERFPYRQRNVTFLRVSADGEVTQAKGMQDKQAMLEALAEDDLFLAAWTGNYSTDIFFLDDREAARQALS